MARQTTTAALAARMIRKEIKKHGVKASVSSKNYAGGDSVRVSLENELPATVQMITDFCNRFEYGSFNAMEDIYEHTNVNDDLPQVKFVFTECRFTDEIREQAYQWFLENVSHEDDDLPETYEEVDFSHTSHGGCYDVRESIGRILTGCFSYEGFWTSKKERIAA